MQQKRPFGKEMEEALATDFDQLLRRAKQTAVQKAYATHKHATRTRGRRNIR
jgi:hypothetical protein